MKDDYKSPVPAWTARGDAATRQVVMAYLGVQSKGPAMLDKARSAMALILSSLLGIDGPAHVDIAHVVDGDGFDNSIAIAYWADPLAMGRWRKHSDVDPWWNDKAREHEGIGYFREILSPDAMRFETLFSSPDRLEGVGQLMGSISTDTIQEHGYWGGARDRLPQSQTDALKSSGGIHVIDPQKGSTRVRLGGHENVAIIRSGQDWGDTAGQERDLYMNKVLPVLVKGMNFLRADDGLKIGCYFNRFMTIVDAAGHAKEKTFGLSIWGSLDALEQWAEHHSTHLAIFNTFMKMAEELKGELKLRLYHEVSVVRADQQEYEYIACHPRTGLLRAAASHA